MVLAASLLGNPPKPLSPRITINSSRNNEGLPFLFVSEQHSPLLFRRWRRSAAVKEFRGLGSVLLFATMVFTSPVSASGRQALANSDPSSVLINCGGPAYVDSAGQTWSVDMDYVNGLAYDYGTTAVSDTNDPTLYQTERYARTLKYAVPLPNGTYTVTLYFAEMYFTAPGQRVFDVTLEGQTVLQDFDIFAVASGTTAVQQSFSVTVNDGTLDIVGAASINNAKFSAIKIVSSIPPSPSDVLINCGGCLTLDSSGQVLVCRSILHRWKDENYSQIVSGTADTALFQSERYGKTLTYQIPLANGNYEITLDFAEMFWNAAGKRVFDVSIQGQTVLQDFDIWALAGQNAAVQRTFVVAVTNGILRTSKQRVGEQRPVRSDPDRL